MKSQRIKCFVVLLIESAMVVALIAFCAAWPRGSAAIRHAFSLAILPFTVGAGSVFAAIALRCFPHYRWLMSKDDPLRISISATITSCIAGMLLILSAWIIFKLSL